LGRKNPRNEKERQKPNYQPKGPGTGVKIEVVVKKPKWKKNGWKEILGEREERKNNPKNTVIQFSSYGGAKGKVGRMNEGETKGGHERKPGLNNPRLEGLVTGAEMKGTSIGEGRRH